MSDGKIVERFTRNGKEYIVRDFSNECTGRMDRVVFPAKMTGACSDCEWYNCCGIGKDGLSECINDGGASEREQQKAAERTESALEK